MAKVVNVHRIDDETFYLVRLTPQEVKPLLPPSLDAANLPEGQVFITQRREEVARLREWKEIAAEHFSSAELAEVREAAAKESVELDLRHNAIEYLRSRPYADLVELIEKARGVEAK